MGTAMFKETHPILGTRELEKALDFYIRRLGFALAFRDPSNPTNYAGVRRDGAGVLVTADDGQVHRADAVVLATGERPPGAGW